ncbi:hypothetical protein VF14_03400 [Nostoc linckia z18]|uniref:Uncharacterized protein n=2 Tax=Nostoc linckia TaxID=92942 RepID=A0A9Q6ENR1_NOSLI|nr:hypothetical protein [Nostoc linckia]PHK41428.1 hypothetical protein VF12_06380 [Nostoc linckia z15]PHK46929.1 hypothetical protein VF13_08040 [Nostoc linckia z16]PHJ69191.1 hypothetical protein VF02_00870 [Nostoc linckia z1]PHJ73342.1 hypothetical protein VF05_01885 [Nostoc linckia z3]PHJ78689.1 hypothetical protein VF03_00870 [Nostoc linckia z2]
MKFSRSLNEIRLQKGGGGGGGIGGTSSIPQRQRLNQQQRIANRANKSTWNSPPTEGVSFYKGKRVKGEVTREGKVEWTVDGSTLANSKSKIPTQELKQLKRAWKEYIKSPNSKRELYALVADQDGRGPARVKLYLSLGFKATKERYGTVVSFDNR